jgi:allantoinase
VTLIVRGGTVVTPEGARPADVVIDGERIVAVEPPGRADTTGNVTVDAGGLLVLPGMVDAHVHFDEPGRTDWEGFDTGSAASAAGGVTTVVDMPIDCDPPTVTAAAVTAKAELARRHSRVDVAVWGGLVPGSVGELEAMAAAGVAGFKAFACPSGWDDFPPIDEASLSRGMAVAARLGLPVAVHCELAALGHTIESEVGAVGWAASLASRTGARLHVVHASSAAAVDEARRWSGVTIETCPHYLTLEASAQPESQCFPPLRDADEREQLWSRLTSGDIDSVASDHSPCPPGRRATWAGIDGAGMAIPLLLSTGRLTPVQVARLTTAAARILRLPGKGAIAAGFDGDLALVDPDATWVVTAGTQWSRHHQSPYVGRSITGRVLLTTVRGRVVFSTEDGPAAAGGAAIIQPVRERCEGRPPPEGCRPPY